MVTLDIHKKSPKHRTSLQCPATVDVKGNYRGVPNRKFEFNISPTPLCRARTKHHKEYILASARSKTFEEKMKTWVTVDKPKRHCEDGKKLIPVLIGAGGQGRKAMKMGNNLYMDDGKQFVYGYWYKVKDEKDRDWRRRSRSKAHIVIEIEKGRMMGEDDTEEKKKMKLLRRRTFDSIIPSSGFVLGWSTKREKNAME